MEGELELPEPALPEAKIGWICFGLALLAVSPFIPTTQFGWVSVAIGAFGLMVWTHATNPALPLPVYLFQVIFFNMPLVVWWISLSSAVPIERWLAPAIATASVGYSFSVAAFKLYTWLMHRSGLARFSLFVTTTILCGAAFAMIFRVSEGYAVGSSVLLAALTTTMALLLQRLLALPFDDQLLAARTKVMAVAGVALVTAFLEGLLPTTSNPALVYGGGWLLAGAVFTVIVGAVSGTIHRLARGQSA